MITFDGKEHDETKFSDKGKVAVVQLQKIINKKNNLISELNDTSILEGYYTNMVKKEFDPKK